MRLIPRIARALFVVCALASFADASPRVPRVAALAKQPKLSAELRDLAAARTAAASSHTLVQVVIQTTAADADAVRDHVLDAGGTFETAARDLVLARVPVSALEALSSAPAVRLVRRPRAPVLFQTMSEGVAAIGAPPWHAAGRRGAGVKVAILDVGFSGYSSLLGTELPDIPSSHIRSFSGDISGNGEVHGTGVAEIVYDIAPQAEMYLVNFSNEVELENAVDWLIEQRVDVINTSWGYPCGGPLDGTGRVNDLVQRATEAGILWIAAAGNFARRHWSATFNDSNANTWHNFTASDDGNTVYLNSGEELRVCVEWDDWANKSIDLDLYVWDDDGYVVDSSAEDQSGPNTNDPFELLTFTASATGYYHVGVKRYSGTATPRMHLFAYPPGEECAIESVAAAQSTPRNVVDELRQFRDRILASSPAGRAWTRSYYRHSAEVKRILLLHPGLAIEAASLMRASRPAIRSVLDPSVAPFVLSAEYTTRIDALLGELMAHAGPALREDLAAFRARAALSTSAGQTAARYWDSLLASGDSPLDRLTFPDPGYLEYTVVATSLTPPADSAHSLTVGAIHWASGALESFSSRGPTADGRRKPDLSATDGICTTTYGDCGGDGFRGTSAAAPHVTGAAALVRQTYPSMSVGAVRNFLNGRAVDISPAGPDNDTGAGRLALGSTSDTDLLPPPTLLHPTGTTSPLSPGYAWTEVTGAAGYRVMVASSAAALPTDPASQTCNGCLIHETTANTFFTSAEPLGASTTYVWQVQAYGVSKKGLWARSSFKTLPPPQDRDAERDDLAEDNGRWAAPAAGAVILTHGWGASAIDTWVEEIAVKMCARLGVTQTTAPRQRMAITKVCQADGWDVWVLDWSDKAPFWGLPLEAFSNAMPVGEALAAKIKLKNYSHIHFIAHSAGSNLIDYATNTLRFWIAREHRPPMQIQNTFLDAYEPTGDGSRYGKYADWADNYVDTRRLDLYTQLDGTRMFLAHAYNIDVTPNGLLPDRDCLLVCRHSRPYRFYGRSVDGSLFPDHSTSLLDPIGATGDVGFPLSTENGRPLNALKSQYPVGKKCTVRDGTCTAEALGPTGLPFTTVRATRNVNATSGAVNYVAGSTSLFQSIRLGSGSQAATTDPTESPSWIVIDVTSTEPVNKLRFGWSFGSAGEGFLRVFVDGTPVRELDQRYVPATSTAPEEIYVGGSAGTLAPGTHRIVFRLDGFGAKASHVELTNVDLGIAAPGGRRRLVRH